MDGVCVNNSLEFRLLNEFQRDFPLCPAPFAELAARLGVGERTVLSGQTVTVDIDIPHAGPNIVEIEASPLADELTPVNNRAVVGHTAQLTDENLASETVMVLRCGKKRYALLRFVG